MATAKKAMAGKTKAPAKLAAKVKAVATRTPAAAPKAAKPATRVKGR